MTAPDIEVVIADDAVARLAAYLARGPAAQALLVMDLNTREAMGGRVGDQLRSAGVEFRELVFARRRGLLADEEQVARVRRQLTEPGGSRPIAVGSGVITDIVRYAAHLCGVDFISVPTAASMDGYASSGAALQHAGVKVTFAARAPEAIFADPRVAAAAPRELTVAGVGDLLAKATARVDWLAASLLYGEAFDEDVDRRVLEPLSFAASNAEAIVSGDPGKIPALLLGLVQSGVAMAIVGSSRPASGCEHHASHLWDLLAARGLRAHASHGLQVGYATRFAMRLQRYAFGGGLTHVREPIPVADPLGSGAREWLGEPSAEIFAVVEQKRRFVARTDSGWPAAQAQWARLRSRLAPALQLFDRVQTALSTIGIPAEPGYLGIDERTLRATFRYATRLRARYTVVDFLEGQGALDQALDAMLSP